MHNKSIKQTVTLSTLSKRAKYLLSFALFISGISAIFLIIQMGLIAKIVTNLAFHHHGIVQEKQLFIFLLAIVILRAFFQILSDMSSDYAAIKVTSSLRMELLSHLYHVGPVGLANEENGKIATLLSEGIEALHPYIARFLPRASAMVIIPLLIIAVTYHLDKWSFIILAITGPLIPIFMILVGYSAQKIMDNKWTELLLLGSSFLDMLQGLTSLRLFGRSQEALKLVSTMADAHRKSAMSVMRVAFLTSAVLEFFASLSIALVAVVFGVRLIKAEIPFETSFFVLLLAPEYFMPLRAFSASYHDKQNAQSAFTPIQRLFSLPQFAKKTVAAKLYSTKEESKHALLDTLKIEDLHLAYQHHDTILKGVNLTLRANELTILTGQSGSGKTSFFRILLGMIPYQQGRITCLTKEGQKIGLAHLKIGWVPQNPFLIAGTIEENLRLAAPHATQEEIESILITAKIKELIDSLPHGLKTSLNEQGAPLSAGQIRRLSIARALLHNPQLLLFDEPTADLDPVNADYVAQAIMNATHNRIAIAISHRKELLTHAGSELTLKSGKIYKIFTNTNIEGFIQ